MVFRLRYWNRLTHWITRAEERTQLQLIIQQPARRICWRPGGIRYNLSPRTADRRATYDHGRGAAVIRDGHPLVVRQQRIIGSKQAAHVGGMVDGSVEIRVVGNIGRQQQFHFGDGMQVAIPSGDIFREVSAHAAP